MVNNRRIAAAKPIFVHDEVDVYATAHRDPWRGIVNELSLDAAGMLVGIRVRLPWGQVVDFDQETGIARNVYAWHLAPRHVPAYVTGST